MTRALVLALVAFAVPGRPEAIALIQPESGTYSAEVLQKPGTENVYVRNDSQQWVSAKILKMGAGDTVWQNHVSDVFGRDIDRNLIGPQSGPFTLYSSNDKEYDQPRGRNCWVELITGGMADTPYGLTAEETDLHKRLFWRGLFDQAILPLINSACGINWSDKTKYLLLLTGLAEIFAHNHQLYEDLFSDPDPLIRFSRLRAFLWREIDGGGPIVNLFWSLFSINLKEKALAEAARQSAIHGLKIVPAIGPWVAIVDLGMKIWNWGPTIVGIMNYFYDLGTVPPKMIYSVYFHPGVGSIEPRVVRTNREDKVFTIRGKRLDNVRQPPMVHFSDRHGKRILSRAPFQVDSRGTSMQVRVDSHLLEKLDGYITCRVTFADEEHFLPEQIRLINSLQITRLDPVEGRPGQQIRIIGNDLHPFTGSNRVFFRPAGGNPVAARVIGAGRNHVTAVVPALDEAPDRVDVWVEESYGVRRLESNLLPFKRLPGTLEDARREKAASTMPELDYPVTGVLTAAKPRAEHVVRVPAGMDVEVELESLSGPPGQQDVFALAHWGLGYRLNNRERDFYAVDMREGPIRLRQPAQRVRAGTHGNHGAHEFALVFARASGDEVHYNARVRTIRRDDLGSGADAEEREPMILPVGGPYTAHLCGDPGRHHEDREDWYLIPSVPDQERVTATITDVAPLIPRGDARLDGATLYLMRDGDRIPAAQSPGNFSSGELPVELRHAGAGERSYLLQVRHGRGLVRYQLRLAVEHVHGDDLAKTPIRSDFNQGTKDGWRLIGDFASGPTEPVYATDRRGNGWISAEDPAVIAGPLDIVLVVDTTGSMSGAIASVKQSARDLIAELTRRSPSLRLGVVGFKDFQDGQNARTLRPLSSDVRARLDELGGWSATGGGSDVPEDALYALQGALEMDWRREDEHRVEVARIIMLITDAPAKADPDRTTQSIATLARQKGVRLYVLPLNQDQILGRQANELARGSQGQILGVKTPAETASVILGAVEQAIDRVSPRYFLAPAKFLGDVSRFEGRTLGFSLKSQKGPARFPAPDVVLVGGGMTLDLVGGLRPLVESSGPFRRCVVPLGERGTWMIRATGQRVNAQEFRAVLRDLRELRLRGEYYAGRDDSALDDVVFGGQEELTDGGMDSATVDWVDLLQRREMALAAKESRLGSAWGDPWVPEFQKKFSAARFPDAATRASNAAVGVRMLLTDGGQLSLIARLFTRERDRLRRAADFLRKSGRITGEQAAVLTQSFRALDEANRRLDELLATAVEQTFVEEHATALMFTGDPANVDRQSTRQREARAALDRVRTEIGGLASSPLIPLLR